MDKFYEENLLKKIDHLQGIKDNALKDNLGLSEIQKKIENKIYQKNKNIQECKVIIETIKAIKIFEDSQRERQESGQINLDLNSVSNFIPINYSCGNSSIEFQKNSDVKYDANSNTGQKKIDSVGSNIYKFPTKNIPITNTNQDSNKKKLFDNNSHQFNKEPYKATAVQAKKSDTLFLDYDPKLESIKDDEINRNSESEEIKRNFDYKKPKDKISSEKTPNQPIEKKIWTNAPTVSSIGKCLSTNKTHDKYTRPTLLKINISEIDKQDELVKSNFSMGGNANDTSIPPYMLNINNMKSGKAYQNEPAYSNSYLSSGCRKIQNMTYSWNETEYDKPIIDKNLKLFDDKEKDNIQFEDKIHNTSDGMFNLSYLNAPGLGKKIREKRTKSYGGNFSGKKSKINVINDLEDVGYEDSSQTPTNIKRPITAIPLKGSKNFGEGQLLYGDDSLLGDKTVSVFNTLENFVGTGLGCDSSYKIIEIEKKDYSQLRNRTIDSNLTEDNNKNYQYIKYVDMNTNEPAERHLNLIPTIGSTNSGSSYNKTINAQKKKINTVVTPEKMFTHIFNKKNSPEFSTTNNYQIEKPPNDITSSPHIKGGISTAGLHEFTPQLLTMTCNSAANTKIEGKNSNSKEVMSKESLESDKKERTNDLFQLSFNNFLNRELPSSTRNFQRSEVPKIINSAEITQKKSCPDRKSNFLYKKEADDKLNRNIDFLNNRTYDECYNVSQTDIIEISKSNIFDTSEAEYRFNLSLSNTTDNTYKQQKQQQNHKNQLSDYNLEELNKCQFTLFEKNFEKKINNYIANIDPRTNEEVDYQSIDVKNNESFPQPADYGMNISKQFSSSNFEKDNKNNCTSIESGIYIENEASLLNHNSKSTENNKYKRQSQQDFQEYSESRGHHYSSNSSNPKTKDCENSIENSYRTFGYQINSKRKGSHLSSKTNNENDSQIRKEIGPLTHYKKGIGIDEDEFYLTSEEFANKSVNYEISIKDKESHQLINEMVDDNLTDKKSSGQKDYDRRDTILGEYQFDKNMSELNCDQTKMMMPMLKRMESSLDSQYSNHIDNLKEFLAYHEVNEDDSVYNRGSTKTRAISDHIKC